MPVLKRTIAVLTVLAAVLIPGGGPARAQQPANPITLDVRAGFDSIIQQGAWAPISVVASNTGDDVKGDLRIEVNTLSGGKTIYTQPVELPRGSRKQIRLYPGDLSSFSNQLEIILSAGGRTLASQTVKTQLIANTTLLIGLWSDTPAVLASLGDVKSSSGKAATAVLTEADLPPVAEAWSALDVLVISDADTGRLTPDQRAALGLWLSQGGRLIVCGGANAQRTLAGLSDLSPIVPNNTVNASLDALGSAVGKPFGQQAPETPLAVGALAKDAHILIKSGDLPLIAWRRVGSGRVDFLAADPGLEPLRSWRNAADLWTLILADGEPRPGWGYGFGANWEPARNAIAAVPGVSLPSVIALCGFLALYVALIGPLNYFVLLRLKRRELAWFTVPALVIVFSLIAYFTGFQLRGTQVILHRLAVIQSWPGRDTARVEALLGVWSPSRTSYDVQVEPGYLARPLPRDLGGALTTVNDTLIEDGPNVTLRGVQVDIGSVQPFVIEGYGPAPRITGSLSVTPNDRGLHIQGDVLNSSTFNLTAVSVIALNTATKLADLPAGGVAHIDTTVATDRASAAGGSGLDPFPASGAQPYYNGGGSSLPSDMAGGQDCYSYGKDQRRCNLATSILSVYSTGAGVYLVGWSDQLPLKTDVLNATSQTHDLVMWIVKLDATRPDNTPAITTIPPGLMSWRVLSDTAGYSEQTPYSVQSSSGSPVIFRFEPLPIIPVPRIASLVLHMEGYDSSTTSVPHIDLWNFSTGDWEPITVTWGDNVITGAQPYVDGRGGVVIRVEPGSSNASGVSGTISLNRLDVTLVGQ